MTLTCRTFFRDPHRPHRLALRRETTQKGRRRIVSLGVAIVSLAGVKPTESTSQVKPRPFGSERRRRISSCVATLARNASDREASETTRPTTTKRAEFSTISRYRIRRTRTPRHQTSVDETSSDV